MLRLIGAVLLGAFVVMAGAEAVRAAPAPLPKKGKEDPLFQQVRKTLNAHGFRLHEMRPGKEPGEWVLQFSKPDDGKPDVVHNLPISTAHLRNPDVLAVLVELSTFQHSLRVRDNGVDGCQQLQLPIQPR